MRHRTICLVILLALVSGTGATTQAQTVQCSPNPAGASGLSLLRMPRLSVFLQNANLDAVKYPGSPNQMLSIAISSEGQR